MTNAYDSTRGNVTDRHRRKLYLLDTYAADRAMVLPAEFGARPFDIPLSAVEIYRGSGDIVVSCCRCYRCGKLLTYDTLTVDRIKPGCKGGGYRRDNIRPSCSDCANKQGAKLRAERRNRVPVVRPVVPDLAARDTPAERRSPRTVPVSDVRAARTDDLRINGQVAGGS